VCIIIKGQPEVLKDRLGPVVKALFEHLGPLAQRVTRFCADLCKWLGWVLFIHFQGTSLTNRLFNVVLEEVARVAGQRKYQEKQKSRSASHGTAFNSPGANCALRPKMICHTRNSGGRLGW
jgi:hypothetical protein